MCDPITDDIEKSCGVTFIKGIKPNIFNTSMPEITAVPDPEDGTLILPDPVTFRSAVTGPPAVAAGKWHNWAISKVDGSYKAEPQGDEDNPTFKVTVEIFIYGITPERSFTINQTLGHDFFFVVPDNNGNNRLIGEMGRGATIKIGEQTNDKSGYKGTIEWEVGHLPYFYPHALPA